MSVLKVEKKLSEEQINEGIIFSSTLSKYRTEQSSDTTHELTGKEENYHTQKERLLDVSFFKNSHFKFNIVRMM